MYSCLMSNEDAALKEMLKHLKEASRRIQASRHLMQEHTLVEDRDYLRLVARLSEALDVTKAAHREAPEAPETVGEGREGAGPRSAARGPQEGSERPWWRRFFGVE